jgi:hypothetical protein
MMRNPVTKRRRRFHQDLPERSHAEWCAAPLQRPPPYAPLRYPSQTPPLARSCQPSLPSSTRLQSVVVAKGAAVEEEAAEREASASASFLPISQSSSAEASCPQPPTPSHPPAPKTLIKVCKTSYNREMVQTIPGPRSPCKNFARMVSLPRNCRYPVCEKYVRGRNSSILLKILLQTPKTSLIKWLETSRIFVQQMIVRRKLPKNLVDCLSANWKDSSRLEEGGVHHALQGRDGQETLWRARVN